jgi:cobaltochelatase CobS
MTTMTPQAVPMTTFIPGAPGAFPGFAPGHGLSGLVPDVDENYEFSQGVLRDIFVFLAASNGDGLFLSGPTGCGKTSVLLQVAARLNWPVRRVNGHARLELHDLTGVMSLRATAEGGTATKFLHGPLARAMKEGSIFVLDEIDLIDPAIAAALNPILEGNPLVLTENGGEVIRPHPNFRFVATGNTAGLGDDSGLYAGAQTQNLAYMDRFLVVQCGYPSGEVENSILEKMFGEEINAAVRSKMVAVAALTRDQFIGCGGTGATLSITFSTRTLIRWANLLLAYSRSPIQGSKLEYALDRALLMRARPHEREAVLQIARQIFGSAW